MKKFGVARRSAGSTLQPLIDTAVTRKLDVLSLAGFQSSVVRKIDMTNKTDIATGTETARKVTVSAEKLLRLKGAREAMEPKIGEVNPTEPT